MYPGMMAWWKHGRMGGCGASAHAGCGGEERSWVHHAAAQFAGDLEGELGGGVFGVRRPLRFLAYKLELNEQQVAELARVLNDLKTERAQVAVDHRRSTAGLADALSGETLDEAALKAAADQRVRSAEQLRDATVRALGRIYTVLEPAQRAQLAYLIRTGALSI